MNYLLRHSIDDNSRKGGWSPVHLNEDGIILAKETAKKLINLPVNQIISSDIVRTKETAEIVNEELNLPITYSKSLREFNAGVAAGMTYAELDRLYPINEKTYLDMNFKYPNGETLGKFKERVLDFYYNVICKTDNTLFITHRNVISVIYNEINHKTWVFNDSKTYRIPHCSIFEVSKNHIKRIDEFDIQK